MIKFLTKERHFNTWGELGKYSAWELEGGKNEEWDWFNFRLKWTRKCDHAGFDFSLELLGYWISFYTYDGRHWNYDANRPYLPNEELKEMEDSLLKDYQKIKDGKFYFRGVKKFEDNATLSWEERYKKLEEHHLQESKSYIDKVESMYSEFQEYVNLESK